jgi:Flp pilus assembly protein TadD
MLNTTDRATGNYNRGLRCLKTGDFAEAITQLRTAAELCSEDEETFAALCLAVDESESEDSTFDRL